MNTARRDGRDTGSSGRSPFRGWRRGPAGFIAREQRNSGEEPAGLPSPGHWMSGGMVHKMFSMRTLLPARLCVVLVLLLASVLLVLWSGPVWVWLSSGRVTQVDRTTLESGHPWGSGEVVLGEVRQSRFGGAVFTRWYERTGFVASEQRSNGNLMAWSPTGQLVLQVVNGVPRVSPPWLPTSVNSDGPSAPWLALQCSPDEWWDLMTKTTFFLGEK